MPTPSIPLLADSGSAPASLERALEPGAADLTYHGFLQRLRSDARTAAVPVALLSADAALTQPLDTDEFLPTLETFPQWGDA